MESTSVIQDKGLPKTKLFIERGSPLSRRSGDKPLDPTTLLLKHHPTTKKKLINKKATKRFDRLTPPKWGTYGCEALWRVPFFVVSKGKPRETPNTCCGLSSKANRNAFSKKQERTHAFTGSPPIAHRFSPMFPTRSFARGQPRSERPFQKIAAAVPKCEKWVAPRFSQSSHGGHEIPPAVGGAGWGGPQFH